MGASCGRGRGEVLGAPQGLDTGVDPGVYSVCENPWNFILLMGALCSMYIRLIKSQQTQAPC